MADQKGIIKLYGSIGGLNFYRLNGKEVVRTAGGGFNGKAIKKSPKMVRVRENMSEFGMVSRLNKEIRIALRPLFMHHKDGTLHYRLQTLLTKIKSLDEVSARGQRTVGIGFATPTGRQILQKFEFTPEFKGQQHVGVLNWNDFSYTIASPDSDHWIFPEAATYIEVSLCVLSIDFEQTAVFITQSEPVFIDKNFSGESLTIQAEGIPASGAKIALLLTRYYQEIGGEKYVLKDKGLMGIGILGISEL